MKGDPVLRELKPLKNMGFTVVVRVI